MPDCAARFRHRNANSAGGLLGRDVTAHVRLTSREVAQRAQREGSISVQFAPAYATPPQAPTLLKRWCRALWYERSIRAQLLLAFVLIDVVAVLVAGSVVILRARMQTRVEMTASMRLADLLVEDAVHLARQELPAEQFLASLPAQLQSMRHVRFVVSDAAGSPIAVTPPGRAAAERDAAPHWFTALVAPPVETRDVAVTVDGLRSGPVE